MRRAQATEAARMTESTIWPLEKNGHKATARTRAVPGVGIELRFVWKR